MKTRDIIIRFEHGMHLRVAALVARLVRSHKATVYLSREDGRRANASSVMDLVTLEAPAGTHLEMKVEGPDEAAVLDELMQFFEHGGGI